MTERHFKPNNLKRFAQDHPNATFAIGADMYGPTIHTMQRVSSLLVVMGPTVAHYSRERDCRRALRDIGYVQEGRVWRKARVTEKVDETASV